MSLAKFESRERKRRLFSTNIAVQLTNNGLIKQFTTNMWFSIHCTNNHMWSSLQFTDNTHVVLYIIVNKIHMGFSIQFTNSNMRFFDYSSQVEYSKVLLVVS